MVRVECEMFALSRRANMAMLDFARALLSCCCLMQGIDELESESAVSVTSRFMVRVCLKCLWFFGMIRLHCQVSWPCAVDDVSLHCQSQSF